MLISRTKSNAIEISKSKVKKVKPVDKTIKLNKSKTIALKEVKIKGKSSSLKNVNYNNN